MKYYAFKSKSRICIAPTDRRRRDCSGLVFLEKRDKFYLIISMYLMTRRRSNRLYIEMVADNYEIGNTFMDHNMSRRRMDGCFINIVFFLSLGQLPRKKSSD